MPLVTDTAKIRITWIKRLIDLLQLFKFLCKWSQRLQGTNRRVMFGIKIDGDLFEIQSKRNVIVHLFISSSQCKFMSYRSVWPVLKVLIQTQDSEHRISYQLFVLSPKNLKNFCLHLPTDSLNFAAVVGFLQILVQFDDPLLIFLLLNFSNLLQLTGPLVLQHLIINSELKDRGT